MANAGAKSWGGVMKSWCLASLLLALATGDAFPQAPPIGQGGAAPNPPLYNRGPHIFTSGATPKFVRCGTGATGSVLPFIRGTDVAGFMRVASDYDPAVPGGCEIDFVTPYVFEGAPFNAAAVSCSVSITGGSVTAPTVPWRFSYDNATIVISGGAPSTPTTITSVIWQCFGTQPPPN